MTTLVDKLRQAVSQYKDKPSIIHDCQELTYGDLLELSESVASSLVSNGLLKGDRVALVVENSPQYVAIYYGILMAGGVVVSLNTAAKKDDLCNWIIHSGANLVFSKPSLISGITDNSQSLSLNRFEDDSIDIISSFDEISKQKKSFNQTELKWNDLASIIYTSGTTGAPKGVMLSHKNLVANMQSICEYLPLLESDRVLNVLPFYYSYGNSVLHTNLSVGATIILENSMMFPVKVVESMQNNKATAFYGVASTFAILLSRAKLENYDLSSIRYITQAGGPMPPAHIEKLMEILPLAEFFMMYGQTEATARLGYIPSSLIKEKLGSAGKAIPGVTLKICDENGKQLANGEEGEIFATGENIMSGYWKNPSMTDEVLVDGWLRTGDIAKMDDDGFVYMTGRRTDMIKSGANRISPKEIEEKLAELDGVEESAAIGIQDDILGQVIKVFVVKQENSDVTKQIIMRHCKENLAQYKIPKEVEFVSQLPKTGSGKLQRFKLLEQ